MSEHLVRIASYANVWEADFARSRLAAAGIPSFLENASFISWCWHGSNATGGVAVSIPPEEVEAAFDVLDPEDEMELESRGPWTCPKCQARGLASWEICWNCGTPREGDEAPLAEAEGASGEETAERPHVDWSGVLTVVLTVGMTIAALSQGPAQGLASMPFILAIAVMIRAIDGWDEPSPAPGGEASLPEQPASAPPARTSRVTRAIVMRAWRAAVIGAVYFPPLNLYSLWLLYRLYVRNLPLNGSNRIRCGAALAFSACAIPLGGLFAIGLLTMRFSWLADLYIFILRSPVLR